jgi:GTP-binding protein
VCSGYQREFVLADIPGIIEGASKGAGLGLHFLKHISRTHLVVFLIDLHDEEAQTAYRMLEAELQAYNPDLAEKPRLVVGTKMDLTGSPTRLAELKAEADPRECLGISAVTGYGIPELKGSLEKMLGAAERGL